MNKKEFLEDVLLLEDENYIEIETNEDTHTIEDGEAFISGTAGTYMSELLGNVSYNDLESITNDIYDFIVNELGEDIESVSI